MTIDFFCQPGVVSATSSNYVFDMNIDKTCACGHPASVHKGICTAPGCPCQGWRLEANK